MLLHHKDSSQKGFKLMIERGRKTLLPSQTVKLRRKKNKGKGLQMGRTLGKEFSRREMEMWKGNKKEKEKVHR